MSPDTANGLDCVVERVPRRERLVLCMQVRLCKSAETFFEEREAGPCVARPVFGCDAPEIIECAAAFFRLLDDAPLQQVRDI